MAKPNPPQDVWQLAEAATLSVPLTVEKIQNLLGTPMSESDQTPGRWEGGPVRLGPTLQVESSVIGMMDGAWSFATVVIQPEPCVTIEMVKEHYPSVELRYGVTGHSPYQRMGWEVDYDWGVLNFGIRVKDDCLAAISLKPTGAP